MARSVNRPTRIFFSETARTGCIAARLEATSALLRVVKAGIEQMASADEPTAGFQQVEPKACKRDRLGRARFQLAKNAADIGSAAAETGKRGIRDRTMSRIYDDAKRGKGQAMIDGKPRNYVRFHIDRRRPYELMQLSFDGRIRDGRIHPEDRGIGRPREGLQQSSRPCRISGPNCLLVDDRRRYDQIPGAQARSEAPGDTKTDDAAAAILNGVCDRIGNLSRLFMTDDQDAGRGGNSCLKGEAYQSNDERNRWRGDIAGVTAPAIVDCFPTMELRHPIDPVTNLRASGRS